MTERHENKAAYQTPKNYQLPKTNYEKKMPDMNKTIVHTFMRKGAFTRKKTPLPASPNLPSPPHLHQPHPLPIQNLKNSPKIGV